MGVPSESASTASSTPNRAPRLPGRVWIALLSLCFLCHLLPLLRLVDDDPHGFLWGDALYYALASESLAERGSLDLVPLLGAGEIRAALAEHQLSKNAAGGLVMKHASILPFVGAPFFSLLGVRGLLLLNVLFTVGIVAGMAALLRRSVGTVPALGTAYLLGTATLVSPYAYNYSADVAGTFVLLAGIYALLRRAPFAGGVGLGMAVAFKLSLLPAAAALCGGGAAWLLLVERGRAPASRAAAVLRLGLGSLWGVAPLLALNHSQFGSIFVTGYQRIALPDGQMITTLSSFNRPLLGGLVAVLFDATHGLISTNPILLLAVFGVVPLSRLPSPRRREIALLLAAAALQVGVVSRYDFWDQSHVSNRFLLVLVPLLSPLVGLGVDVLYRAARLDPEAAP